jgi:hypothetical protein
MALLILNCSADSPDYYLDYLPEDLSYSDRESILEIILEDALDIENAMPEYDDFDSDDGSVLNGKKGIDFCIPFKLPLSSGQHLLDDSGKLVTYLEVYSIQFHPEILPPPPKA